jgi:hypothetical protein
MLMTVTLLVALAPTAAFAASGSAALGSSAYATGRYYKGKQHPQRNYGYHQHHHSSKSGYFYWSGDDDDDDDDDPRWEGHHSNWDGSNKDGSRSPEAYGKQGACPKQHYVYKKGYSPERGHYYYKSDCH